MWEHPIINHPIPFLASLIPLMYGLPLGVASWKTPYMKKKYIMAWATEKTYSPKQQTIFVDDDMI